MALPLIAGLIARGALSAAPRIGGAILGGGRVLGGGLLGGGRVLGQGLLKGGGLLGRGLAAGLPMLGAGLKGVGGLAAGAAMFVGRGLLSGGRAIGRGISRGASRLRRYAPASVEEGDGLEEARDRRAEREEQEEVQKESQRRRVRTEGILGQRETRSYTASVQSRDDDDRELEQLQAEVGNLEKSIDNLYGVLKAFAEYQVQQARRERGKRKEEEYESDRELADAVRRGEIGEAGFEQEKRSLLGDLIRGIGGAFLLGAATFGKDFDTVLANLGKAIGGWANDLVSLLPSTIRKTIDFFTTTEAERELSEARQRRFFSTGAMASGLPSAYGIPSSGLAATPESRANDFRTQADVLEAEANVLEEENRDPGRVASKRQRAANLRAQAQRLDPIETPAAGLEPTQAPTPGPAPTLQDIARGVDRYENIDTEPPREDSVTTLPPISADAPSAGNPAVSSATSSGISVDSNVVPDTNPRRKINETRYGG